MDNPQNHQSVDERKIEDMDRVDQFDDGVSDDSSSIGSSMSTVETSEISAVSRENGGSCIEVGLRGRERDILVEEGDVDLLLQQSDGADRVIRFLQALDLHVMGACRADERLKPLLKLNFSGGAAEDRLLAHLSQHFEASEVGLLARCLCIPLVSIRVGKIDKQGTLMCPTGTRGNLNLALLPTSDLHLSFIGDDGRTERLLTLSKDSQCSAIAVEEIPVDKSGRSFLIKIPDREVFYFWCSEKSKLLGIELLSKIKDFLKRKPSLAELTGISESRLRCFATHLRAYLVGSTVTNARASAVASLASSPDTLDSSELCQTAQSSPALLNSLLSQHYSSQAAKTNLLSQGSSPSVDRGTLRRLGDIHLSRVDNLAVASPSIMDESSLNHSEKGMLSEATETCLFSPSSFLESLGKSAVPPLLGPASQVPSIGSSCLSPYYCWCPPVASTLQCTIVPPQLPFSLTESPSLPPLSSLLPDTGSSSVLKPMPPLNLSDFPSMDFPPFLPEPLVRLPFSMPISQHIPTFTPLVCDPIVHIPVIDFCSSGQGYLVSAGPAISTAISPLHPKLVNPLIPETDSMVEKGARETLRLLISSTSQTNLPLVDALPSVLTSADEKQSIFVAGSRGLYSGVRDVDAISNSIAAMGLVTTLSDGSIGSRGLYGGVRDVDAISNSIAAMGLVTLSEGSIGGAVVKGCINQGNLVDHLEKSGGPGGSCSDDDASIFTTLRNERTE